MAMLSTNLYPNEIPIIYCSSEYHSEVIVQNWSVSWYHVSSNNQSALRIVTSLRKTDCYLISRGMN